jgi:hypothetical protein
MIPVLRPTVVWVVAKAARRGVEVTPAETAGASREEVQSCPVEVEVGRTVIVARDADRRAQVGRRRPGRPEALAGRDPNVRSGIPDQTWAGRGEKNLEPVGPSDTHTPLHILRVQCVHRNRTAPVEIPCPGRARADHDVRQVPMPPGGLVCR